MRPSVGIGVLLLASTVVLAGIVAASGCTVLTNDGLPDDAGRFEGGDATTQTCATCLGQECTGQWAACLTDPACLAIAARATGTACAPLDGAAADGGIDPVLLYAAFSECTDAKASTGSCATDCASATNPAACAADGDAGDAGATDASDASDAADDVATADAGGDAADASADAEAGTPTPTMPTVDTCSSCVSGKCGDAKKACAIGSECAAYLECTFAAAASASASAADECGRQHATGKTAAAQLATCTRVGCTDACGF